MYLLCICSWMGARGDLWRLEEKPPSQLSPSSMWVSGFKLGSSIWVATVHFTSWDISQTPGHYILNWLEMEFYQSKCNWITPGSLKKKQRKDKTFIINGLNNFRLCLLCLFLLVAYSRLCFSWRHIGICINHLNRIRGGVLLIWSLNWRHHLQFFYQESNLFFKLRNESFHFYQDIQIFARK